MSVYFLIPKISFSEPTPFEVNGVHGKIYPSGDGTLLVKYGRGKGAGQGKPFRLNTAADAASVQDQIRERLDFATVRIALGLAAEPEEMIDCVEMHDMEMGGGGAGWSVRPVRGSGHQLCNVRGGGAGLCAS